MSNPTWRVSLAETSLGEEESKAAYEVVRSGWLTQGARVLEFERLFALRHGVPHAIAVSNCTVGLELALQAVGVGPGDEVIVPALTFVATANAAGRLGATPVFADVRSPQDLTLDPDDVARKCTPKTRAVCPVHFAGWSADLAGLQAVCNPRGIALVEDCAHAPGGAVRGRPCGSVGSVGAFSFFGNKNMTTGEGGMLTTTSDALAATLRLLRSHGMTTGTWDRHRGHSFSYDVVRVGTNARMDEIRAAIGMVQLGRLDAGNAARRERVREYRALLAGIAGLELPFGDEGEPFEQSAHHLQLVLLPEGTDRAAVMTSLREQGVQSSLHYPPTTSFSAYENHRVALPVTDAVAPRLLTLPLFATMTTAQVELVCAALRVALGA